MPISCSYPSLWRRFAAIVYDCLLLFAISMAYGGMCIAFSKMLFPSATDTVHGIFFQLGWTLTLMGFFCYFWRRGGQTLGMRAWRLRLVQQDGSTIITYRQCLFRCLFATLSLLLLGIGYWWSLVDRDRQTLHDRLTGTRTVLLLKK